MGRVVGAAVGGGFILVTIIVVLATAHLEPTTSLYIIMGSWFLKMVAVIVVMGIVRTWISTIGAPW